MAALLCQSVGKLCNKLCEPCNVCCECLSKAVCSPFFPYLALTCALNVPPTVFGIRAEYERCPDVSWLSLNAIGTLIHIWAAFYIANKIQSDEFEDKPPPGFVKGSVKGSTTSTKNGDDGAYKRLESQKEEDNKALFQFFGTRNYGAAANSMKRTSQILCYDVGVAIYIVIFVLWVMWQTAGVHKVIQYQEANGKDENVSAVCANVKEWMTAALVCGWLYMALFCCSFVCSLMCLR